MLDAYKLHVAIKVTEELLYDNAFHLENYIIDQFGKALANAEEDAFLNGDGTGKPLGIFAPKGGAQASVVTAKASIESDDIINLVYALKHQSGIRPEASLQKEREVHPERPDHRFPPQAQGSERPVHVAACPHLR